MPKRTIGLETIRCRPGHNRRKIYQDLSDIDGDDLLHLFRAWADDLDPDQLVDKQRGRYLKVTDIVATGRSVMVTTESGYFGSKGNTFNVETHQTTHSRSENESATIMTRVVLTVAPGSEIGVFTVEREGLNSGGPALIKRFRLDMISSYPEHSFELETVVESAAWLQGAELLAVTAVAYSVPVDIGDGTVAKSRALGQLEQRFEPPKGQKALPYWLLTALQEGKVRAADFMGFSGDIEVDETFVTVGRDGRTKTYNINSERVPSVRVVITEDGDPPLTPTPFLRRCQTEVGDYYKQMGLSWNDLWRSGRWERTALAVKMPAAHGA